MFHYQPEEAGLWWITGCIRVWSMFHNLSVLQYLTFIRRNSLEERGEDDWSGRRDVEQQTDR